MDYQELFRKKELYSQCRASIPELTMFTFEQAFEIEYTHNSTAIEGNTLSLIETKVLLEDGTSIGGKELNPVELAAWIHAEFVKIHPFWFWVKEKRPTFYG